MMKSKVILIIFLLMILTACSLSSAAQPGQESNSPGPGADHISGQNPSREADARSTAVDFYDMLNRGLYDRAVGLYGGSYEVLQGYNPGIDPQDRVALLKAGCEFNGLMCLSVSDISLITAEDPARLVFEVSFANPDGSQFVLGPCCGATEVEMPPVSVFAVQVSCPQGGSCQVMDLPPYVP